MGPAAMNPWLPTSSTCGLSKAIHLICRLTVTPSIGHKRSEQHDSQRPAVSGQRSATLKVHRDTRPGAVIVEITVKHYVRDSPRLVLFNCVSDAPQQRRDIVLPGSLRVRLGEALGRPRAIDLGHIPKHTSPSGVASRRVHNRSARSEPRQIETSRVATLRLASLLPAPLASIFFVLARLVEIRLI